MICRCYKGKAEDKFRMKNEFMKIPIADPAVFDSLHDEIFLPLAKGSVIFNAQDTTFHGTRSCQNNNNIRPLQKPVLFRSSGSLGAVVYK
jgi:hypothetical protein